MIAHIEAELSLNDVLVSRLNWKSDTSWSATEDGVGDQESRKTMFLVHTVPLLELLYTLTWTEAQEEDIEYLQTAKWKEGQRKRLWSQTDCRL